VQLSQKIQVVRSQKISQKESISSTGNITETGIAEGRQNPNLVTSSSKLAAVALLAQNLQQICLYLKKYSP